MKKKFIVICLLAVMLVTFLSGCGLFGINTEKDMQRVIAEVGDSDYKDEIKKFELVNYYLSAGSTYIQQGMTVEETMNYLLDQMIYQRILVQDAVQYLLDDFDADSTLSNYIIQNGFSYYEITGLSDTYDKKRIDTDDEYLNYEYEKKKITIKAGMEIKDILKPAENEPKSSELLTVLLRVYYDKDEISKTNDAAYKFSDYYKDLKDSKVFSDYLSITALNSFWGNEKSILDTLEKAIKKDYGIVDEEEEEEAEKSKRPVPEDKNKNPFVLPTPNEKIAQFTTREEAKTKLVKNISKNFYGLTYEEYKEKQIVAELEGQALRRHQELVTKRQEIAASEFSERFNAIYNSEKQQFSLSLSDYKTKLQSLGDDTFILYNPVDGVYGYVKQILIGFDSDLNRHLERQLNILKAKEMTRAAYVKERSSILQKMQVKDLRENLVVGTNNDTIFKDYPNFSDSVYKMDGAATDFYTTKFQPKFGGTLDANGIGKSTLSSDDLIKNFTQYIFMYNTDPGMFNNSTDYLLTELNHLNAGETYVSEFAVAAREVIKKSFDNDDIGYYKMVETDYGYHIIICSDIITADKNVMFDADEYSDLVSRIKNDNETSEDKASAIYKLYKIIQNEKGSTAYNKLSEDAINKCYAGADEKGKKVTKYEYRYKDLLK